MSCVSPSSSVSQQVPKPFDFPSRFSPSFPEFTSELLAKLSGAEVIEVIRLHYDACVRVAEVVKLVPDSCASCLSSDVSASVSKTTTSSRPNSRARRRARRVASNSEIVLRSASPVVGVSSRDSGYCYLELFPERNWPDVAARYGSYPKLVDLIMAPMSEMIPEVKLLSVAATVGVDCIHVGQGSVPFVSLCAGAMLCDSLQSVPGTLSAFCTWRDAVSVSSTISVGATALLAAIPPLQYMSVFRHDKWAVVYAALGLSPTLKQLMSLDHTWYVDFGVLQLLMVEVLSDQIRFSASADTSLFDLCLASCPQDVERIWSVKSTFSRLCSSFLTLPVLGNSDNPSHLAKADFSTNVCIVSAHLSDSTGYVADAHSNSMQVLSYQSYGRSVFQAVVCATLSRAQISWIPSRWDSFHFKFAQVFPRYRLARQLVSGTPLVGASPSAWLYFSLALLFDRGSVDIVKCSQDMHLDAVIMDVYQSMASSLTGFC